ncbi:MAG: hypothetical protein K8U57_13965 [Planctomycetes bacterium]|nr:hypothetical protein [Planctomycetota bacterium]
MPAPQLRLEDAENPGQQLIIDGNPQTVVVPGPRAGTATIIGSDGARSHVVGDYREIHARVQDAVARGHESGEAPRMNTGVS